MGTRTAVSGRIAAALVLLLVASVPAIAQDQRHSADALPDPRTIHAVRTQHDMVVAQERIAAEIGEDVLKRGGNAVDAAVAVGFTMAVTYPRAGNIGGGGFMVIHLAKDNQDVAIDYRETAPAATTRDIFLGPDAKPDQNKSLNSALGIGVPGTVAGLSLALEKYGSGKFTLAELLQPRIAMANNGIKVADVISDTLDERRARV